MLTTAEWLLAALTGMVVVPVIVFGAWLVCFILAGLMGG